MLSKNLTPPTLVWGHPITVAHLLQASRMVIHSRGMLLNSTTLTLCPQICTVTRPPSGLSRHGSGDDRGCGCEEAGSRVLVQEVALPAEVFGHPEVLCQGLADVRLLSQPLQVWQESWQQQPAPYCSSGVSSCTGGHSGYACHKLEYHVRQWHVLTRPCDWASIGERHDDFPKPCADIGNQSSPAQQWLHCLYTWHTCTVLHGEPTCRWTPHSRHGWGAGCTAAAGPRRGRCRPAQSAPSCAPAGSDPSHGPGRSACGQWSTYAAPLHVRLAQAGGGTICCSES